MGLFASLLSPQAVSPGPLSDYWYQPVTMISNTAGQRVDQETAMRLSAVWRCVSIIAGSVAMLPLKIYRALPDGGKEEARDHPLWDVLHDQPNDHHTSYVWREVLMKHLLLRGDSFSRILPGRRGPVDQLELLHPDRVRVERLAGGRRRYLVRGDDGVERAESDEDIFHVPGLSDDGVTGMSIIKYAAQSFGVALAQRDWGASYYKQAPRPGAVLEHPAKMSAEAQKRLRQQLKDVYGGSGNAGEFFIAEEGMKLHVPENVGISAEDADWVMALAASVEDIARWFGVPNHMLGAQERATSWGTGIEQMSIGFVVYTLMHWLKRIESAIKKDLITASNIYFAEFEVDGLLRGDIKTRYDAYKIGREIGVLTIDDILKMENRNAIGGLAGGQRLVPLNFTTPENLAKLPEQTDPSGPRPAPTEGARAQLRLLVTEQAKRVVRKETAAMQRAAVEHAADPAAWAKAVEDYYAGAPGMLVEALHMTASAARGYCDFHRRLLLDAGPGAMEDWAEAGVETLVSLVLGEEAEAA